MTQASFAHRPEAPLWRGMDRAALDQAYDNTGAVPASATFLADWANRSAALRARQNSLLDLAYGPRQRNRLDIFRSGAAKAPLLVFVHGGYWQRNSKDSFSCMAEGALAAGMDVAVPGYTLAPEGSLKEMKEEVAAVLAWLRRQGPAVGVAKGRLIVSGWSAGGHLAASAMAFSEVDAGLAISGIFDLEPIRLGKLNIMLGLTSEDVQHLSPIHTIPQQAGPLVVAYGTDELPELKRQSSDYALAWQKAGRTGGGIPVAGMNHFSILEELAQPGGALTEQVVRLAGHR